MRPLRDILLPKKLTTRLFLIISLLVIAVGGLSGYLQVRAAEQELLDTIILGADQLSNGITAATWHAMLADNREAAYETMKTIALRQGIDRIRIFNREGRVMYSTVPHDSGSVPMNDQTCAICHSGPQPLVNPDPHDRSRIIWSTTGRRELAMVTPIYNEPACSNAACHAHPAWVKVLGVLDVTYSLENVDQVVRIIQGRSVILSVSGVIVLGAFMFFFVRLSVQRPLAGLVEGFRQVGQMRLDTPVAVKGSGEFRELASSFEAMREQLQKAVRELNELAENLEAKVRERTEELNSINQKLYQSDRLASLGQLAASVAHEINNPIAGVLNLGMLLQRIVGENGIPPERVTEVRNYLNQMVTETTRVGRIVTDLLAFSRRPTPQRADTDLNAVVRQTLSIINHKLHLMGVDLDVRLAEDLPRVRCDGSQMQQVLVNLVLNGAEATHAKEERHVRLTTSVNQVNRTVLIEVADNGEGIPPENLARIYDPFFTTKGEGKGVGLGLAVVYGIVHSHGGEIRVESTVGAGSLFRVALPIAPDQDDGHFRDGR